MHAFTAGNNQQQLGSAHDLLQHAPHSDDNALRIWNMESKVYRDCLLPPCSMISLSPLVFRGTTTWMI